MDSIAAYGDRLENIEWETAYAEDQHDHLETALGELNDIQETLEAMKEEYAVPPSVEWHLHAHYDSVCKRLGVDKVPVSSFEAFNESVSKRFDVRDSLEADLKETVTRVWSAIIAMIEKIAVMGQKLWNFIFDASPRLMRKAQEVRQDVTGQMKPGQEFDGSRYKNLCWVKGKILTFDNTAITNTTKWLDGIEQKVSSDVQQSEKLATGLQGLLKDIEKEAKQSDVESETDRMTDEFEIKMTKLVERSFLHSPIQRVYRWRTDAASKSIIYDNASVLFDPKEPEMPGGYAIMATAEVAGTDQRERAVRTVRLFDQFIAASNKVNVPSKIDVNKNDLERLLDKTQAACSEIARNRAGIERRSNVNKQLKLAVRRLFELYQGASKDETYKRYNNWRSNLVGSLVRSIIKTLYKRADIYGARVIKVARDAIRLGMDFSYTEGRKGKTIEGESRREGRQALPAS